MAIVNEGTVKYEVTSVTFERALPGVQVSAPMVAPYMPQARVTVMYAVMVPNAAGVYESVATKSQTWAGDDAAFLLASPAAEVAAIIAKVEAQMVVDAVVAGTVEVVA